MNAPQTILCLDLGAGSLKWAKFAVDEAGALRLSQYAIKPIATGHAASPVRDALATDPLQQLMADDLGGWALQLVRPEFAGFCQVPEAPCGGPRPSEPSPGLRGTAALPGSPQ